MTRPGPGSKRSPTPWSTSSSTRAFGIFTTNSAPGVIIAKILPFTFSAPEPKPCRDSRVTPPLPAIAPTTGANRGSSAAFSRLEDLAEDLAAAFLRLFDMARRHCIAPRVSALLRAPNLYQRRDGAATTFGQDRSETCAADVRICGGEAVGRCQGTDA